MVIGDGLMARAFNHYIDSDVVIIAAGVSDSTQGDKWGFKREESLLKKIYSRYSEQKVVYFSSAEQGVSPYLVHKKNMESLIEKWDEHIILRLPQVVGRGGNRTNLFNYLVKKIKKDEIITVKSWLKRSLIDVDDVVKIVDYLIEGGYCGTYNLRGVEFKDVDELVSMIADRLNKKPLVRYDSGNSYPLDEILSESDNYIETIITKYL